jgi:hypothetical protein
MLVGSFPATLTKADALPLAPGDTDISFPGVPVGVSLPLSFIFLRFFFGFLS